MLYTFAAAVADADNPASCFHAVKLALLCPALLCGQK